MNTEDDKVKQGNMTKCKESDVLDIIRLTEYTSYDHIVGILFNEQPQVSKLEISKTLKNLIHKKYIYRVTGMFSGLPGLYVSAYMINGTPERKYDSDIIRATTKPISIYYNLTNRSKVISITIETEALLSENNFKVSSGRILKLSVKYGANKGCPKYTYILQCLVENTSQITLYPNIEHIYKITGGTVDDNKYYYSMRITVKEFGELEFDINQLCKVMTYIVLERSLNSPNIEYNSIGVITAYEKTDKTNNSKKELELQTIFCFNDNDVFMNDVEKGKLIYFVNPIIPNKKFFNNFNIGVNICYSVNS